MNVVVVIKLILPGVSNEPSVHRGYQATISKDGYFQLLDWISTETWDWNIGVEHRTGTWDWI